jgi:hypothetical protein
MITAVKGEYEPIMLVSLQPSLLPGVVRVAVGCVSVRFGVDVAAHSGRP